MATSNIDFRKTYKVGQYHYGRHRSQFGVWVCNFVTENASSSSFVADFNSREEARQFVWKMNGWEPRKQHLQDNLTL